MERPDDITYWGDSEIFKILSISSSEKENWIKVTEAMEIVDVGCVVRTSTRELNETPDLPLSRDDDDDRPAVFTRANTLRYTVLSESITNVPDVKIEETLDGESNVISRKLVPIVIII